MKIPVYKIFWASIATTILLLALHSFFVIYAHFSNLVFAEFLVQRFNLNAEANLPTWYETILLFSISACSFFLYHLVKQTSATQFYWRKFWLFFGSLYLLLSLDEAAQIHELIDRFSRVKWVYVYAPIMGTFFLVCLYYFFVARSKDHALRNWIIGGLIIYALGGLLVDWVELTFILPYAWSQITSLAEEGLEMLGSSMVLTGCLMEVNRKFDTLFQPKESENS
ncbi:MAG: hypothetical protein BGO78_12835 [Chloroflexi bacterium 44-23]|nr:MAG: hypothetical protein BGO78_12835 [Chloroflexi bacterium 44-23]